MNTAPMLHLPWNRPRDLDQAPCLRDESTELTHAAFADRVEATAEQFAELGVRRGSVVAVHLPNRIELLVALVAAWRLGAAATPVNPVFTATEARHQFDDADVSLVVVSTLDPELTARPQVAADELRSVPRHSLPPAATAADDLALVIYTSGSTGRPKGVMLPHSSVNAMATTIGEAMALTREDHCLLVLPLFHVNAICVSFLACLVAGAQVSVLRRFHPVQFLDAVRSLRPTYFSAVPTIYAHLLALPPQAEEDTSSVRFAICGAAPAAPGLLAEIEQRFGFPVLEGYGLTEATCASTANPLDGPRRPGTVGTALPGQQVAVMAPEGTLLPAGERGEVVIRGDVVMQGYLNRPEATAEALTDGWLHTGDVGILDTEGYLTLVDRIKDMIIRGGENLYPQEIENALLEHPAVFEAAVVGAPDALYGEVPVAFVALKEGAHVDEDELRSFARRSLTSIKVPTRVTVLAELPKNPVGKPDKPSMRSAVTRASRSTGA